MVSQEALAVMLAQSFGPMLEALRDAVSSSAAAVASASATHVNLQHASSSAAAAAAGVGSHRGARGVLCPDAVVLWGGVPAR